MKTRAEPPPKTSLFSTWTRVDDDTGGGNSLTNFPLIYVEGDSELAARAIESAFCIKPGAGTPMYGEALSFAEGTSFAAVSWFERGCGFDNAKRTFVEAQRCSWESYHTPEAWMTQCDESIDGALAHAQDYNASRHGKMLLIRRPEALGLAIAPSSNTSWSHDDEQTLLYATELVEMSRASAVLPLNQAWTLKGLERAHGTASWIAMAQAGGDQEAPPSWLALADSLTGSDFVTARTMAAGDLMVEKNIDVSQLRLAWAVRPEHDRCAVLDGLDADGYQRLRTLALSAQEGDIASLSNHPTHVPAPGSECLPSAILAFLDREQMLRDTPAAPLARPASRL